jgi:hypothetical protein
MNEKNLRERTNEKNKIRLKYRKNFFISIKTAAVEEEGGLKLFEVRVTSTELFTS